MTSKIFLTKDLLSVYGASECPLTVTDAARKLLGRNVISTRNNGENIVSFGSGIS